MGKKMLTRVLIGTLFLVGTALIFYPTVSNMLAERYHVTEIENYDEIVTEMEERLKEEELQKAREYNNALTGSGIRDPFIPESGVVLPDNYTSVLGFSGGIMGYIKIPEIDVYLPIYHGTSENVLRKGSGHMENTAIPIGGEGNHTILTGHTGLSTARLFTDLDKLETGDVFYITVLDTTIAYAVDQILVVTPDDTSELVPVPDEDYVTLVTCTPYAINSHRLLVRGTRIPYTEDTEKAPVDVLQDWHMILAAAASLMVLTVIICVVRKHRKNRKMRDK